MNKKEFSKLWNQCIEPTFLELAKIDSTLYIRNGSFDSLCLCYNEIKNNTKRMFMKNSNDIVKLDRHKVAACMAKAIVVDKPVCRKIQNEYMGTENDFVIANEALAFSVATAILKAYIELKIEKHSGDLKNHKEAYKEICNKDFVFPDTIMDVDYKTSVCWAWHHNILNGYFDVLGTANLFFMIEKYSIEVYSN